MNPVQVWEGDGVPPEAKNRTELSDLEFFRMKMLKTLGVPPVVPKTPTPLRSSAEIINRTLAKMAEQ